MGALHGDCRDLLPTLADASVDLILADLPYGTTACKWDSVIPLDQLWPEYKRVLKPRGAVVLTASQPFTTTLISSNLEWFKYCWVWEKMAPVGFLNARRMPLKDHEDIAVFYQQTPTYNPQGLQPCRVKSSRKNGKTKRGGTYGGVQNREYWATVGHFPRSVLKIKRDTHKQMHPTQKPLALMEYLILTYSNPGDLVLDNTMGVGTTGVAAVNTGRAFIGMELDPAYFAIAQARIAEATP